MSLPRGYVVRVQVLLVLQVLVSTPRKFLPCFGFIMLLCRCCNSQLYGNYCFCLHICPFCCTFATGYVIHNENRRYIYSTSLSQGLALGGSVSLSLSLSNSKGFAGIYGAVNRGVLSPVFVVNIFANGYQINVL